MMHSFICNVPKSTVRLQRRSISTLSLVSRPQRSRPQFLFGDNRYSLGATVSATRISHPTLFSGFHTTPRNQGSPFLLLAALLKVRNFFFYKKKSFVIETRDVNPKTSTGFEVARTASRIALTFIPLVWIKYYKVSRVVKTGSFRGVPTTEEDKVRFLKWLRNGKVMLRVLLSIPFILFSATIIASLERTPLTGRCVLLSPD
jgi:hypothetical protein